MLLFFGLTVPLFSSQVLAQSNADNAQKANEYSEAGGRFFLASESFEDQARGKDRLRFVFWNVENFFDTLDCPDTRDESFTPNGDNKWNGWRFQQKLQKVGKTILATGGWEAPAIVGLCEIENRTILNYIVDSSMLTPLGYEIAHRESADRRGIDVALLYRPEKFDFQGLKTYRPVFPGDPDRKTRDVLHVWGSLSNGETLHAFINHWPSRWSGMMNTAPNRVHMARIVREKCDSLLAADPEVNIVVTGDFNDEPENESMAEVLSPEGSGLVNLMEKIQYKGGSHFFDGEWGVLDQFVVSENMLDPKQATSIHRGQAQIFDFRFLLKENGMGLMVPNRTYQGPAYVGGFSDHLPILIDLNLQ